MQEDMIGLTTDELMICHVIAQALPLHAPHGSCQCRNEDTCGYCRFIAAGVVDHLIDNGYQIAHIDGDGGAQRVHEPNMWCDGGAACPGARSDGFGSDRVAPDSDQTMDSINESVGDRIDGQDSGGGGVGGSAYSANQSRPFRVPPPGSKVCE